MTITIEASTGNPIVDRRTAEAAKDLADSITLIFHSRPMDVTDHKLKAVREARREFLDNLPSDLRQQAISLNEYRASGLQHKYGQWGSALPWLYAYSGQVVDAATPVTFGEALKEAYCVAREVGKLLDLN